MFSFCKPVSSRKRFLAHRELNQEFSFTLYDKASSVNASDWDAVTQKNTVFLEREYLRIIEGGSHTKLACRYVTVYHQKKACGIIYFQIIDFNAGVFGELISNKVQAIRSMKGNLFKKYIEANKEEVLLRLFTCGNNLVSGEYGFIFDKKVGTELSREILLNIIDLISKEEKLRGAISAILLKDYYKPLKPAALFSDQGYTRFSVEPNMVVGVPGNANTLDEYLGLFSKKYRNRAKAILKGLEEIEVRSLTVGEIKLHENKLYALYEGVFEKAKFKLIKLPENYFSSVKALFEREFTVKVFLLNGNIVAFGSSFCMPDNSLEAHYIGFEYHLNNEYNLYQNLLYSMINEAIINKCSKVNLGRTAAEIKTTVGAEAKDLICYIKPLNTVSKLLQNPFISFLQPEEWTPRSPFKESNVKEESS